MPISIADRWYETHRYRDDVTRILESHIDPGWRCNIWHVRGHDADILVDSGLGLLPIQAEVVLVTEKPLSCVATHSHVDHVVGHHEFSERIVHAAEADILTHPTRHNTVAEGYVTTLDWFRQLPPADLDPNSYCVKPAPPTRVVKEGDFVDLGDRHFDVLHMPGHFNSFGRDRLIALIDAYLEQRRLGSREADSAGW